MLEKTKVLLDFDPGHDDAIALLVAAFSPSIELVNLSTVSGNNSVEKTTRNALQLCEYFSLPYEVHPGAKKPLKKEPMYCPAIHGESGLDGFPFKDIEKEASSINAEDSIIETCLQNSGVVIVACGPLTNIATALKKEPKIKEHISKIVIMGGSMGSGNVTPAAEFNIYVDPEAAEIVFGSHLPVYMNGLDVTREVLVRQEVIKRMNKIGNRASDLFKILMDEFNLNQKKIFAWSTGGPLHDPITLVSLIDPKAVTYEYMNVEIDCSGGSSYGRTNCDRYSYLNRQPNAYVAVSVNVDLYWDVIEKSLRNYH